MDGGTNDFCHLLTAVCYLSACFAPLSRRVFCVYVSAMQFFFFCCTVKVTHYYAAPESAYNMAHFHFIHGALFFFPSFLRHRLHTQRFTSECVWCRTRYLWARSIKEGIALCQRKNKHLNKGVVYNRERHDFSLFEFSSAVFMAI